MKEGFDKEIDSLLRRRAGVRVHSFDDGDSVPRDEAHLDADELNAFAEGALPAAARVAAISHLADCDECRGIAVSLTRASGAEAKLERLAAVASVPASVSKPARGWLSALFAPRVLRYVAPLLAVSLVAAVSFVALRTRRGGADVAQHAARSESAPAGIVKEQQSGNANATANANANGVAQEMAESASRNASAANVSAHASERGHGGPAGAEPPAPTEAKKDEQPAPPPPSKAGEAPADTATVTERPATEEAKEAPKTENKAKAAPPTTNEDEVNAAEQSQQVAKRANQARGVEAQTPDGSRAQKRGGVVEGASNSAGGSLASNAPRAERGRSGAGAGATASRRGRQTEDRRERGEDDKAARDEEMRAAAGHRFRREGGAWIDVNYKSSMPSTGVRRGTEAFRALVADIPELGRVAEQVSGEVVVVVKGRAYRIR